MKLGILFAIATFALSATALADPSDAADYCSKYGGGDPALCPGEPVGYHCEISTTNETRDLSKEYVIDSGHEADLTLLDSGVMRWFEYPSRNIKFGLMRVGREVTIEAAKMNKSATRIATSQMRVQEKLKFTLIQKGEAIRLYCSRE